MYAETGQIYPENHFFHQPAKDCHACYARKEIRQRILDLERQLAKLRDEERGTLSQMNAAHDPIQKMPPEVVSYIFEQVLDEDHTISSYNSFKPLNFGRICRYWRQVAWANPSLWSRLTFILNGVDRNESKNFEKSFEQRVTTFRGCLSRSGHLPLSVFIGYDSKRRYINLSLDIIAPLCEAVAKPEIVGRIIHLYLDVPISCLKYFNGVKTTNLKKLEYYGSDDERDLKLTQFISGVEKLTTNSVALRDHILHINFSNLTDFDASWWSLAHLNQLMRNAPNLQRCTCGLNDVSTILLPEERTMHPRLNQLDISVRSDTMAFLNHFTFPNLQFLKLKGNIIDPQDLASFFKRSQCCLRDLDIAAGRQWTIADLEAVLASLSELPSLFLHRILFSTPASEIFQTIFGSSAAGRVEHNTITKLDCDVTWRVSDNWDFIINLFGPMVCYRGVDIKLSIYSYSLYDDTGVPSMSEEVIQAIRELEVQGWRWFVGLYHHGELLRDLTKQHRQLE